MVQLTAIFATQILYGAIGVTFVVLFDVAVRFEWNSQLAPRSTNRPRLVIKNALLSSLSSSLLQSTSTTTTTTTTTTNKQTKKYVGGGVSWFSSFHWYPLSFIVWATRLTYRRGLQGIPGTGSRNNGWAGPTLKWNLDGVILLKYHRMLMKISLLATLLCLLVLLPAFSTAECDPQLLGLRTCQAVWNLTGKKLLNNTIMIYDTMMDAFSLSHQNNVIYHYGLSFFLSFPPFFAFHSLLPGRL
jgi:hypothetical protein